MIAPDSKGGTVNVWEDWRGNHYTVGSLVLYARMSGRSCELAEGRVVDLYEVYQEPAHYKWTRLEPGEAAPLHEVWKWKNKETGETLDWHGGWPPDHDESGRVWEKIRVSEPVKTERRAKIMPTMRTSRFNSYSHRNKKWVWDEETRKGGYVDIPPEKIKPIMLTVTESITAVTPYDIKDDM